MKILDLQPELDLLLEKQMIFNKGAPYGQIVFMMGGSRSGKGFVIDNFMQGKKFKRRDVDKFKDTILKIAKLKNKYQEIQNLNLKNPNDVFLLHRFLEKKHIIDKTLDNLLIDLKKDRLPNIIFDRTGKTIDNIMKRIQPLKDVGYKPKDIHLVWVLSNYKISLQRNKKQSEIEGGRVVPEDVLLQTHKGAADTMNKIIQGKTKLIGTNAINGEVKIVLNNPENTIFWKDEDGNDILTTGGEKVIKGFSYLTLKKAGKKITGIRGLKDTIYKWILNNIPPVTIAQNLGVKKVS